MVKKIVIGIGIVILIAFSTTAYYFFNNAEKIANDIVRNEFIKKYNESNSSQYDISVGDIKLNIFTGSFKIKDLVIVPKDSLITLDKRLDGSAVSNTTFHITISEIALSGFDLIDAINNRFVNARKFEIQSPIINIYQYAKSPNTSIEPQDTLDLRTIFLINYDSFNLDELFLHDISANVFKIDVNQDTSNVFSINNLNHQVFGVRADKNTLFSDQYIEIESYNLNSKNIEVDLNNKSKIQLSSLRFNSVDEDLIIKDFSFLPTSTPADFLSRLKYKKGWVSFSSKEITISKIDVVKWFHEQEFHAQQLTVIQPNIKVFNKEVIPFDPNEHKPMLGDMILNLPIPINMEEAIIKDAEINIDIDGKQSEKHGKLDFQKMDITAENITNISSCISENSKMIARVNTQINNTGKVSATLIVDLGSTANLTQFNVQASKISFANFNSVLKPILRISLTNGEMVSLKINSTLSSNGAFGTMDAHYEGLKIQLEGKDIDKKPGFFNNMASGLANGILKSENVPGDQFFHQGKFRFKRTQHDNFFKMLWLVTMHGLEDSILGSNVKDEKKQRKKEKQNQPKKKLFNFKK
jgi:hypothetical protein